MFFFGYHYFGEPPKNTMSHNFCFPQGRVLKYPSKGQPPFRGQVKGGDVFLAYLDGQTTPRALAQASIHDLGTGSYVLLLPGDTLLPGDQFGYQKSKGHQGSTYLGRVKKSCDARRKVRRCLKALVVGLNG